MLKFVFIAALTLFTFAGSAQTDFKSGDLDQIRSRNLTRMPKGTKVVFEVDLTVSAYEQTVEIVKNGMVCYFSIGRHRIKDVDQYIKAGTTKEIADTLDSKSTIFFGQEIYIVCNKSFMTIGEFADALKGKVSFQFPPLEPPQEFTF